MVKYTKVRSSIYYSVQKQVFLGSCDFLGFAHNNKKHRMIKFDLRLFVSILACMIA